jgi:hypothetical protein
MFVYLKSKLARRFTVLGIATAFYLVFATASSCNSFFVTASTLSWDNRARSIGQGD